MQARKKFHFAPPEVAIDFGSSGLKVAVIQEGIPLLVSERELAPGLIERGKVKDVEAVAAQLRELWEEEGLKARDVKFVFQNQLSVVRSLKLRNPGSEDLLRSAVEVNARNALHPIDPASMEIDYQQRATDVDGLQLELAISAADTEALASYLEVLRLAKLRPLGGEMVATSLVRMLVPPTDESSYLLLVIGAELTLCLFFNADQIHYVRPIPLGGNDFTQALTEMEEFHDWNTAEHIKKKVGLVGTGANFQLDERLLKNVHSRLLGVADSLVQQIVDTIEHYETLPEARPLAGMSFFGGSSKMPGLIDQLMDLIPLDLAELNMRTHFRGRPEMEIFAPGFGAIVETDSPINLIPSGAQKKRWSRDVSIASTGRKEGKIKEKKAVSAKSNDSKEASAVKAARGKTKNKAPHTSKRIPTAYRYAFSAIFIALIVAGGSYQFIGGNATKKQQELKSLRVQVASGAKLKVGSDLAKRVSSGRKILENSQDRSRKISSVIGQFTGNADIKVASIQTNKNQISIRGTSPSAAVIRQINTQIEAALGNKSVVTITGNKFVIVGVIKGAANG